MSRFLWFSVDHKKRDILFLTITMANLNRFLWSPYVIGGALYCCRVISIYTLNHKNVTFYF